MSRRFPIPSYLYLPFVDFARVVFLPNRFFSSLSTEGVFLRAVIFLLVSFIIDITLDEAIFGRNSFRLIQNVVGWILYPVSMAFFAHIVSRREGVRFEQAYAFAIFSFGVTVLAHSNVWWITVLFLWGWVPLTWYFAIRRLYASLPQWRCLLTAWFSCVAAGSIGLYIPFDRLVGTTDCDPTLAKEYYLAGIQSRKSGRANEAREYLKTAIRLGEGKLRQRAEVYLKTMIPMDPVDPTVLCESNKAYNLRNEGRDDLAEPIWKKCIQDAPRFEWPYVNLADVYCSRGQYEEAVKLLDQVTELNPSYLRAWVLLSEVRQDQGRYSDAVKAVFRAYMLDSMNDEVRERIDALKEAKFPSKQGR